jgi:hypothetical protein
MILVIIAAITAPGEKKFAAFINNEKGGDTMNCKPIIGKRTRVKLLLDICSVTSVSYCESNKMTLTSTRLRLGAKRSDGSDSVTALRMPVAKITHTESYLGLFGKYWKL